MGNKITDYFLRMFPSKNEEQGLCVKFPCMSTFAPVLDIYSIPNEPDMLLIMIGSASSAALPPVPQKSRDYVQNLVVHKSQVAFRTISRWPD